MEFLSRVANFVSWWYLEESFKEGDITEDDHHGQDKYYFDVENKRKYHQHTEAVAVEMKPEGEISSNTKASSTDDGMRTTMLNNNSSNLYEERKEELVGTPSFSSSPTALVEKGEEHDDKENIMPNQNNKRSIKAVSVSLTPNQQPRQPTLKKRRLISPLNHTQKRKLSTPPTVPSTFSSSSPSLPRRKKPRQDSPSPFSFSSSSTSFSESSTRRSSTTTRAKTSTTTSVNLQVRRPRESKENEGKVEKLRKKRRRIITTEEEEADLRREKEREERKELEERKRRKASMEQIALEKKQKERLKELKEREAEEARLQRQKDRIVGGVLARLERKTKGKTLQALVQFFGSSSGSGIDTGEKLQPLQTSRQLSRACKLLLVRYHPDRQDPSLPLEKRVEAEEIFKILSNSYTTFKEENGL